ncbi:MAG: Nramp family divalent metal transporter [Desulfobacterales bacterium]|nr:MAG: Nramp family divalent metal transporter [Desulfobacterales bacterium]
MREAGIKEAPKGLLNVIRHLGPGVILSGSVIGSGELLVTTRLGAQFGYVFLWGVILCCMIKYFVQVEIGRYCISKNLTGIKAFNQFPIAKIRKTNFLNIFFFAILAMMTPAFAGIFGSCAGLLYSLFPAIPVKLWGIILFASVTVLLWRGYYKDLEKTVVVLVGGFSLSILICFFLMQGTTYHATSSELLSGMTFNVPEGGMSVAMALMGSVGVTAAELFFYPYLLKEKGYGEHVGVRPADNTEGWALRQKGWMKVLKIDALICTMIAATITVAYYLLAASVFYYGLGTVPTGIGVVEGLAGIFTESFGKWSYGLFMFGAFCTLYSTLCVSAAAFGRLWTDFFDSLQFIKADRPEAKTKWYRFFQTLWPALWLAFFLGIPKPMTILIWGLRFNGLWLPFLSLAAAFLAKKADSEVKPSTGSSIALWLTIACILVFTLGYFVLITDAPLAYRVVFSILTVVFALYTVLACFRVKDFKDFDQYRKDVIS